VKKIRPQTVGDYIAATPAPARRKLREMRACVRSTAPGATECLKWGMPAYSQGRILVIFGAFKHHIGFYPTASAIRAFRRELARFEGARGSVQFPLSSPLPLPLIRRIVAFRVKECIAHDAKWRS